jgi:hypothetical protein
VSPSRRDPDVLRMPGSKPEPVHPLGDLDGTGKAKKGRRRRAAPGPAEEDPRDRMMLLMLERIQQLNSAVAELSERVLLGAVRDQVHLRRIERLEERVLEAVQTPPGAIGAASDGETAAGE